MGWEVAILGFLQVLYSGSSSNNTNTSPFLYNKYECLTPNNKMALCLSLFTCPPLLRIHLNAPSNNRSETFLEKSSCARGFGAAPFVCCSSEVDFSANIPTNTPNTRSTLSHTPWTTTQTSSLRTTTRGRTTMQTTPKTNTFKPFTTDKTTRLFTKYTHFPRTPDATSKTSTLKTSTSNTSTRRYTKYTHFPRTPDATSKTSTLKTSTSDTSTRRYTKYTHFPRTSDATSKTSTLKTSTSDRSTRHYTRYTRFPRTSDVTPNSSTFNTSTSDRSTRRSTKYLHYPRTSDATPNTSTLKTTTRSRTTRIFNRTPSPGLNLLATPEECTVKSNNDICQYNSLVLVQGDNSTGKGSECSGSLISHFYVLTSALCALNYKSKIVRVGNYNSANSELTDFKVESKVIYPTWNDTGKCYMDDIALLRLSRSVPYNDYTAPICLPSTVGFKGSRDEGNVSIAAHASTNKARKLRYFVRNGAVVNDNNCLLKFGKRQMCSSGKFNTYVPTNFGGPLARIYENKWVISGIASRGYNMLTNTFVVVPEYEKWILKNIKE